MPSFDNKKHLRFIITMGTGKFGSSNNDTITMEGFRSTVDINKAGGMTMGALKARIYGVSQSDMNSVTTLQYRPDLWIKNTITVFAIDGEVETMIFFGNIINAWGDYNGMPDVFLHIDARAAIDGSLNSIPPKSYKGPVEVVTVMSKIAEELGYSFENNGVNASLVDVYLPNTGIEQARDLARAANINLFIDDNVLAITPRNTPRKGDIPLISASTGLIGYPTFDGVGVNFRVMFNPGITFGGAIKLETDIERAAGEWYVNSISHRLESEKPGGAWFSTVRGNAIGLAVYR